MRLTFNGMRWVIVLKTVFIWFLLPGTIVNKTENKSFYFFKNKPNQPPASISQAMPRCTIRPPQTLRVL